METKGVHHKHSNIINISFNKENIYIGCWGERTEDDDQDSLDLGVQITENCIAMQAKRDGYGDLHTFVYKLKDFKLFTTELFDWFGILCNEDECVATINNLFVILLEAKNVKHFRLGRDYQDLFSEQIKFLEDIIEVKNV